MITKGFTTIIALLSIGASVHAFPQLAGDTDTAGVNGGPRPPVFGAVNPPNPPPAPTFLGAKLVNDAAHPFRAPKKTDLRGPCPALNTLANHGVRFATVVAHPFTDPKLQWLPRDGVATPSQIIIAVQEGFNMESLLARTTTYAAHLLDGNPITDLLSIGSKTPKTGPDPPAPAIVGGLNNHGTFEGDASMTRADAFFGDNHIFNPALFEEVSLLPIRRDAPVTNRFNPLPVQELQHGLRQWFLQQYRRRRT
jgi:Peroxidase, family 2